MRTTKKAAKSTAFSGTDNEGAQLSVKLDANAGSELLKDGVFVDNPILA
jgi:hypothetical protein